jgi:hypothetical protein
MFTCLLGVALSTSLDTLCAWLGVDESLVFVGCVSAVLFAIYLGLCLLKRVDHPGARRLVGTIATSGFLIFTLGAILGIPYYFWWNVLFLTLALAVVRRRWNWRTFLALGLASILAAYLVAAWLFLPTYRMRSEVRRQFPVESLRERLAYEPSVTASNAWPPSTIPAENGPVAAQLEAFEGMRWRQSVNDVLDQSAASKLHQLGALGVRERRSALLAEHTGFVHEFINASGFGSMRLKRIRIDDAFLVLPRTQPIPIPVVNPAPSASDSASVRASRRPEQEKLLRSWLQDLHLNGLVDFANPAGYGFSVGRLRRSLPDLDQWVGFQAHSFRKLPEKLRAADQSGVIWRLKTLELVSLLKQKTPRVYISKNLPRMDELRNAPTRDLTAFETESLQAIRKGEAIHFHEHRNDLRMMGPLLAAPTCTQCHNASEGDLLGAFTYHFVRDPGLPEPKKTPTVF